MENINSVVVPTLEASLEAFLSNSLRQSNEQHQVLAALRLMELSSERRAC